MKVENGAKIWVTHWGIRKNVVLWIGCDLGYWTIPLIGLKIQQGLIAVSLGFLCFRVGFYWWQRGENKTIYLQRYVTYPAVHRHRMDLIWSITERCRGWSIEDLTRLDQIVEDLE